MLLYAKKPDGGLYICKAEGGDIDQLQGLIAQMKTLYFKEFKQVPLGAILVRVK